MITNVIYPQPFSLAGNPMMVACQANTGDHIGVFIEVFLPKHEKVSLELQPVGKSTAFKATIDISGIVKTFFDEYLYTGGTPTSMITTQSIEYNVAVAFDNEIVSQFTGTAFNGGASDGLLSQLSEYNLDMFSYRLLDSADQFLFTTRTNHRHIKLSVDELYPFFFIYPKQPISFRSSGGHIMHTESFPENTGCLLDIDALRKEFLRVYYFLPSYIAVYTGDHYAFDITITPPLLSEHKHTLLFKNSLGSYEIIVLTGEFNDGVTFAEANTYHQFTENQQFEENRFRVNMNKYKSGEAGYKTKEELAFILDMLSSDEIYLLTSDNFIIPYLASTESELEVPEVIRTPQSVHIKLKEKTSSSYHSPALDFSYPDKHGNPNLTRLMHPEWNHRGIIYANDNMLYTK